MSQFDAFGTPGGSQGDGSAAGNGSSLAGVSSSNNGSTAAALASKSNQNILTFYKNPSLLYDMARQGRMSQAQATQSRNLFLNNYTQFLLHAALNNRPNPYNDIPDELNPSLESKTGPALIKPAEWAVKLSMGEQQVNIRLSKVKEQAAAAAAAAAAGASDAGESPVQASPSAAAVDPNDVTFSTTAGAGTTSSINLTGSAPPSRTSSPAPGAASTPGVNAASQRKYFVANELAKLNALPPADRNRLLDEHPLLKNKYEYTMKQYAELKRNREAAAAAQNAAGTTDTATLDAAAPGETTSSLGTDGGASSSSLAPAAASSSEVADTTENDDAAAMLPDVSKFSLSLPGLKIKKKDTESPVKGETLDRAASSMAELADDPSLNERFGGPSSVDMERGGSGSGSGSSEGQSLAKARLQSQVNSGAALELPSPFNLATSGSGASSSEAKPQFLGAMSSHPSLSLPTNASAIPTQSARFSKTTFTLQSRSHPPPPPAIPLEPESMRRKRKVRELFKEVAPGMEMEVGVDEVFDDLIDTFLRDVMTGGAQCAKHRKVDGIELKDIGLYMHHAYNLQVAGYDTLIPVKQSIPVGEPDRRGRPKGIVPRLRRPGAEGETGAPAGV